MNDGRRCGSSWRRTTRAEKSMHSPAKAISSLFHVRLVQGTRKHMRDRRSFTCPARIDVLRGAPHRARIRRLTSQTWVRMPHYVKPHQPETWLTLNSAAQIRTLRHAISAPRFSTYLRYAHRNSRRALELYVWNIRAGAMLFPILQINEIALRNAVNDSLVSAFGAQWPYSAGFLRALPAAERATFLTARQKLERKLRIQQTSTGDVVAAQTYWFWVSMLTRRFHARIW